MSNPNILYTNIKYVWAGLPVCHLQEAHKMGGRQKERERGGRRERRGGRKGEKQGAREGGGWKGGERRTCARASVMRAIHVLKGASKGPFSDSSPLFFCIFL